ncbi:hypothetical protein [Paraliomyxa miuraensis]|uniref:hypothetical protein n=1 Tax=Paraliomyxa miuraensis TaxID=376150 RepID=UPI00225BA6E1|nr:hypothetical protein [Paraliomyxa miuraensis]MCX4240852.1 hypothetical protein [Paraliomyxa miuraensis]
MDTDNRVQNLLFLLSAAPIGLGCVIVSDDTDTEAGTTATSSPTSTTADTETPTTGGATEVATSEMTSGSTASMDTTEGPEDTTAGEESTSGGGSAGCEAYADLVAECYMDPAAGEATLNYCIEQTAYYEAYGAECLAAFEDFTACLSALTCDELTGADPVCEAEFEALNTTCFPE